jgi:hypothetical protein
MELKLEEFDHKINLDQQQILFKDAFPEVTTSSLEGYFWQFHRFPNAKKTSYEYCSYLGNEMVGYYAAVPYRYKIGEKYTDVGMVCGVMTSSSHRGKGIFTKMGSYSTKELSTHVPFTTGYPIRKSVIPGHLKVGWKIAFELPLYMKFFRINALIKSKLPAFSFISNVINPMLWIYNKIFSTSIDKSFSVEMFDNVDSIHGYDEFINDWLKTQPNALIKNKQFAQWRYGRPDQKYHFVVIRQAQKLVGFTAYCSIIKEGVPSFCLLDLTVLPQYYNSLGLLYKTLELKAKESGVEAIMLMQSRYSASNYKLYKNGFLKSPFKFFLIIKNLTGEFQDEQLMKEENWHLMWVDSDDL